MSSSEEPVGSIDVALVHASRLLDRNPALAAEQAGEILKVAPNQPVALLLAAIAQRMSGHTVTALASLERLVSMQTNWAAAHYDRDYAVFTDLSFDVTDQLKLNAGTRELGQQHTASWVRARNVTTPRSTA